MPCLLKDVPENIVAPGDEIKVNRHTSYRAPDSIPAAPSKLKATAAPPAKWIVDTGTGIDIIGSQGYDESTLDEKQVPLEHPLTLDTAGGDVIVKKCLPVKSNHIGQVRPVVCDNSPSCAISWISLCYARLWFLLVALAAKAPIHRSTW